MAFQMNFTLPTSMNIAQFQSDRNIKVLIRDTPLLIQDGYVKIGNINGNKSTINILVEYCIKKGEIPVVSKDFSFTPDVSNDGVEFFKQGYTYLKTLPEFLSAVDILEEGQTP